MEVRHHGSLTRKEDNTSQASENRCEEIPREEVCRKVYATESVAFA